jgi:NADPH:quinone reductase-like Zn-dependent oxidoreductase
MSTYRALVAKSYGGPQNLEGADLPLLPPGPGEIRVQIRAAGVGSTDLTILRGHYPFAPKLPLVPGYECAGVVDAVGKGVKRFEVGQRVAGLTVCGGFAHFITHTAADFFALPDEVSFTDAAASLLNFATAWRAIEHAAHAQPAMKALVTGAAGGVGSALVQLLRFKGLAVFGAASVGKHDFVRKMGAMAIDSRAEMLARAMYLACPEGVDLAFDSLGARVVSRCIDATRVGGRIVGLGFSSDPTPMGTVSTFARLLIEAPLRGRRATFYGITREHRRDPKPLRDAVGQVFALVAAGVIRPPVAHMLPLAEAPKALAMLQNAQVAGKIVLVVDD